MGHKIINYFRERPGLVLVLVLGFVLRAYKAKALFMYSHDQDLASWFVMDVTHNHHLRLIGQETSQQGVFIGPLWYYLLIPFYVLGGAIGSLMLPIVLGTVAIVSVYWVFARVFNEKTALIGSLIYAVNIVVVFTDREVAPTMPVMMWTVWFLYLLQITLKGERKISLMLTGLLAGLVWHLNLALALNFGVLALAYVYSYKISRLKFEKKFFGLGFLCFGVLVMPFILFEARHGWIQVLAVYNSVSGKEEALFSLADRFDRVLQLVFVNVGRTTALDYLGVARLYAVLLILGAAIWIVYKKWVDRILGILLFLWAGLYIVFFSFNKINPSEYYFNGMTVLWISVMAIGISKIKKEMAVILMVFYVFINLNEFRIREYSGNGFNEKMAIIMQIKEDAVIHNYPCVAVSYIVKPGYDLGYRYLFATQDMHVNRPDSSAPVYSIVFPLSMVNEVDYVYGKLGLVLPDYEKYSKEGVRESCSGDNSNLTDPMFGFTN